jgi:hypothetical protein
MSDVHFICPRVPVARLAAAQAALKAIPMVKKK